jgi:hypothetical protein
MMKSFLFALSLFVYFLIADILFVPLAMVPNYNLFLLLIFLLCCFILTYKAVAAESQVRRLIYGSFGGLLLWSLIGELCPSLKAHPASLLSPISTVDIKHPSTLVYLVLLFVTLTISYVKGGLKDGLAMLIMVFGTTWGFELYMENYSTRLPVEIMPDIAYILGGIWGTILLLSIYMALRSTTLTGKIFWGYWIYFAVVTTLTSFIVLPRPMPLGF